MSCVGSLTSCGSVAGSAFNTSGSFFIALTVDSAPSRDTGGGSSEQLVKRVSGGRVGVATSLGRVGVATSLGRVDVATSLVRVGVVISLGRVDVVT